MTSKARSTLDISLWSFRRPTESNPQGFLDPAEKQGHKKEGKEEKVLGCGSYCRPDCFLCYWNYS
jgi:hypothetical protein